MSTGGEQELVITPKGLEIDNSVNKQPINGTVTKAEVDDVNVDGSPEIYVYITLAGKSLPGRQTKKVAQRDLPSRTDCG